MPIEAHKVHTVPLTAHKDEDGRDIYKPKGATTHKYGLNVMYIKEIPSIYSYDNKWGVNTTLPLDLDDHDSLGEHMQPGVALVNEIKERNSTNPYYITKPDEYAYPSSPSSTPVEFVLGRINAEDLTVDIYHFEIAKKDYSYAYGFVGGHGTGNGSGGYVPPYYREIMEHNGLPIMVKTEEEAIKVIEECNKHYDEEFHSTGEHSAYDRPFPFEIDSIKIPSSGIRTTTAEEAIAFLTSIDTDNE